MMAALPSPEGLGFFLHWKTEQAGNRTPSATGVANGTFYA